MPKSQIGDFGSTGSCLGRLRQATVEATNIGSGTPPSISQPALKPLERFVLSPTVASCTE